MFSPISLRNGSRAIHSGTCCKKADCRRSGPRGLRPPSDVLEFLHGHGMVHGDLAPEHVLVGADDTVKLVQFGLASKAGARRLTFTKLSQVVGDSPYVSPEEVAGKKPTAQSDVYSVGIMLYEMLAGTLPFSGSDPSERLATYFAPPRTIDPSISPELQEVV